MTTASLPALRLYSSASKAFDAGDLERARDLLTQAVSIDSNFAMAWRKLSAVYSNSGLSTETIETSKRAYQLRDHLPPLERHLTEGNYLFNVTHDYPGASSAYRQALQINPDEPAAVNNLGMTLMTQGRNAEAEAVLRHGVATGLEASVYTNLADALLAQDKLAAVDSLPGAWVQKGGDTLRAGVLDLQIAYARRNPGRFDSLSRRIEPALPTSGFLRVVTLGLRGQSAELRGELQRAGQIYQDLSAASPPGGAALRSALKPAYNAVIQRAKPDEAWPLVQAALTRFPLDSIAPRDRPYGDVAEIAAMLGRAADVRALRSAWDAITPQTERDPLGELWWNGLTAMSEQRWDAAAAAFGQLQRSVQCLSCGAYEEAFALERGGHVDSAVAVYERTLSASISDPFDFYDDPAWYPVATLHVGEYYADRGDKAKALSYLTRFTALWKNADADLQPQVRTAKGRIAQLTGEQHQ